MAYEVKELVVESPERDSWKNAHQLPLTVGNAPRYKLCLVLQSRRPTIYDIGVSFFCCFRRSQKHDSRVVLAQHALDDRGEVTKETLFQLCKGSPLECSVKMQGVHNFLKLVLFHGQTNVSVELLKDLIKPYGPVDETKLIKVVVRRDMVECLENECFQLYINQKKKLGRGSSLLKFAMEKGQAKVTKRLLIRGDTESSLDLDRDKNNAFHVAAKLGRKETVLALFEPRLSTGGCSANSLPGSPVRAVCPGGTASFADTQPELLNQKNVLGDTPLILATREDQFDIVVDLLVAEADPNIQNCITGYTSLHIAASKGYTRIVKILLVFGADMMLKCRHGTTAVDCGAKHPEVMKCFTELKNAVEAGKKPAVANYHQEADTTGPFVLCLDGGGMRGLCTVILLREIEDRIRKVNMNFSSLAPYFDYIAGTSVGTCIALPIVYRHLSMADIFKVVFDVKNSIFYKCRPFPEETVDSTFQRLAAVTPDTLMSAVTQPKVIAITCKADTSPPSLHVMRNTGEGRNGEKGPDELKVWEAIRASSAAPTYFPSFDKFLDGGILANNPTITCITEVIEDLVAEEREPRLGMVVSVGTGVTPPRKMERININRIRSPQDLVAGAVGITNFVSLILDQMTFAGGSEVARARAWCTSMKSPFFRLDPDLSENVDLAETDDEVLVSFMFEAFIYGKRQSQQIDAIAKILLSRRPRNS